MKGRALYTDWSLALELRHLTAVFVASSLPLCLKAAPFPYNTLLFFKRLMAKKGYQSFQVIPLVYLRFPSSSDSMDDLAFFPLLLTFLATYCGSCSLSIAHCFDKP